MVRTQTRTRTVALVAGIVAALFVAPVTEARVHTTAGPAPAGVGAVLTQASIAAAADRLSGRRLTVVCAAGAREWAYALTEVGLPGVADEYYGFSLIHRAELRLSPYVCEGLRLGGLAATRRSHELQVAWSVDVLIHESVHLARFSTYEAVAEACARIALPIELHRLFGVALRSAEMRRLTSAAAWFRRTMPPAYRGGTCTPPGA